MTFGWVALMVDTQCSEDSSVNVDACHKELRSATDVLSIFITFVIG